MADVLLYLGFNAGGWLLIYVACFAIYLITYFFVLLPELRRQSGSVLAAVFAALLAFKIGQIHFILRPVILSFLLFTTLLVLVERCRAARLVSVPTAATVLLLGLWSNLHPSFVLGLALIALSALAPLAEWLLWGVKLDRGTLGRAGGLLFFSSLATLANPYGFALHESVLSLTQSDFFMGLHQEWRSPDFQGFEGQLMQLILGLIIIPWIVARRLPDKLSMFSILTFICFTHLAFNSVRMLPYFGIVASVPLAQSIELLGAAAIVRSPGVLRRFCALLSRLEDWHRQRGLGVLGLSSVLLFVGVFAVSQKRLPFYEGQFGPPTDRYPYGAIESLAEVPEATILSVPDWGGFMVLRAYPRIKPVIDDRNTLVGESFYREYQRRFAVRGDWALYAQSLGADYLLLPAESNLALVVEPENWPVRYRDSVAILFEVPKQATLSSHK